MEALALIALIFASVATLLHLVSTAVSLVRLRSSRRSNSATVPAGERVTIIRPVCGVDPFERFTATMTSFSVALASKIPSFRSSAL